MRNLRKVHDDIMDLMLRRDKRVYLVGRDQIPHEHLTAKGRIMVEAVDEETGKVEIIHVDNTQTSNMSRAVASLLVNGSYGRPTKIRLGTGSHSSMSYASSNIDSAVFLDDFGATSGYYRAQGFVLSNGSAPPATFYAANVLVWLKRTGTPAGNVFAAIYSTSGGAPNATVTSKVITTTNRLALSTAVSIAGIGTSYDWVRFNFPTPALLTNGTTYSIVLLPDSTYDKTGSLILDIGVDNSASTYSNGAEYSYVEGSGWVSHSYDWAFRVMARPDTTLSDVMGTITTKSLTLANNPSPGRARMGANFTTAEGNDYIGHIGLLDASDNLLAIAGVAYNKTSSVSINVYWIIDVTLGS